MVYPNPSGCYKTIYQVIFEDPSKKVPCIEMSVLCVRNIEIIGCVFFPSSKFSQKIRYVFNLAELAELVPMEYVGIPECIRQYVPCPLPSVLVSVQEEEVPSTLYSRTKALPTPPLYINIFTLPEGMAGHESFMYEMLFIIWEFPEVPGLKNNFSTWHTAFPDGMSLSWYWNSHIAKEMNCCLD